jgi:hypothetical protein
MSVFYGLIRYDGPMIDRFYIQIFSDVVIPTKKSITLFLRRDQFLFRAVEPEEEIVILNKDACDSQGIIAGCLCEVDSLEVEDKAIVLTISAKRSVFTHMNKLKDLWGRSIFIVPALKKKSVHEYYNRLQDVQSLLLTLEQLANFGRVFKKQVDYIIKRVNSGNSINQRDLFEELSRLIASNHFIIACGELPVDQELNNFSQDLKKVLEVIIAAKSKVLFSEKDDEKIKIIKKALKTIVYPKARSL